MRHAILHILKAGAALVVLVGAALALVCVLVVVQGQRNDARRVDALLLLSPAQLTDAHLSHAFDLYRRDNAPTLILVGDNVQEARDTLTAQNLPDTAFHLLRTTGERQADIRAATLLAYQQGVSSVLVVDTPDALLLDVKMLRDLGLHAYGSPVPALSPGAGDVVWAGVRYWDYVLFRATPLLAE